MRLNPTAPWVSCEPWLESMSLGLRAPTTWKWIAIWQASCLPSRTDGFFRGDRTYFFSRRLGLGPRLAGRTIRCSVCSISPIGPCHESARHAAQRQERPRNQRRPAQPVGADSRPCLGCFEELVYVADLDSEDIDHADVAGDAHVGCREEDPDAAEDQTCIRCDG